MCKIVLVIYNAYIKNHSLKKIHFQLHENLDSLYIKLKFKKQIIIFYILHI